MRFRNRKSHCSHASISFYRWVPPIRSPDAISLSHHRTIASSLYCISHIWEGSSPLSFTDAILRSSIHRPINSHIQWSILILHRPFIALHLYRIVNLRFILNLRFYSKLPLYRNSCFNANSIYAYHNNILQIPYCITYRKASFPSQSYGHLKFLQSAPRKTPVKTG